MCTVDYYIYKSFVGRREKKSSALRALSLLCTYFALYLLLYCLFLVFPPITYVNIVNVQHVSLGFCRTLKSGINQYQCVMFSEERSKVLSISDTVMCNVCTDVGNSRGTRPDAYSICMMHDAYALKVLVLRNG